MQRPNNAEQHDAAKKLRGRTANYGRVIRVGDTVHRPRAGHTRSVHALLQQRDPTDIADQRRDHVLDRYRVLLDACGADAELRRDVADATPSANRWIADVIEHNARRGHPAFGRLWQSARGMHRRASAWLSTHTDDLLVAGR